MVPPRLFDGPGVVKYMQKVQKWLINRGNLC